MGTNFYFLGTDHDAPGSHIGKRCAAGHYCWDCRQTFCVEGEQNVHAARTHWRDVCPRCGQQPTNDALVSGAVAVELGFADPYQEHERTGIGTVSSFSWAVEQKEIWRSEGDIEDEYGRVYTLREFQEKVLANCPIEFTDSIGVEFS